jgi:ABC-type nickel/cobalt efflux system permease component RcnA
LLVGSIAAGRPGYGILLTVAFGIGMAAVLVGVGVMLVRARAMFERMPSAAGMTRVLGYAPLVTAFVFVVVGAAIAFEAGTQLT